MASVKVRNRPEGAHSIQPSAAVLACTKPQLSQPSIMYLRAGSPDRSLPGIGVALLPAWKGRSTGRKIFIAWEQAPMLMENALRAARGAGNHP